MEGIEQVDSIAKKHGVELSNRCMHECWAFLWSLETFIVLFTSPERTVCTFNSTLKPKAKKLKMKTKYGNSI